MTAWDGFYYHFYAHQQYIYIYRALISLAVYLWHINKFYPIACSQMNWQCTFIKEITLQHFDSSELIFYFIL